MEQNIISPDYLDGAKVIKWAWSGKEPFGFVSNENNLLDEEIFGLAICKYDKSESIYRFSCNKKWEVIQDSSYDTIEEAIKLLPKQYRNIQAHWQSK